VQSCVHASVHRCSNHRSVLRRHIHRPRPDDGRRQRRLGRRNPALRARAGEHVRHAGCRPVLPRAERRHALHPACSHSHVSGASYSGPDQGAMHLRPRTHCEIRPPDEGHVHCRSRTASQDVAGAGAASAAARAAVVSCTAASCTARHAATRCASGAAATRARRASQSTAPPASEAGCPAGCWCAASAGSVTEQPISWFSCASCACLLLMARPRPRPRPVLARPARPAASSGGGCAHAAGRACTGGGGSCCTMLPTRGGMGGPAAAAILGSDGAADRAPPGHARCDTITDIGGRAADVSGLNSASACAPAHAHILYVFDVRVVIVLTG